MIEFRTLKHGDLDAWFDHCTLVFGQGEMDPALRKMFEKFWYDDPDRDLQGILVAMDGDALLSGVQIVKRQMLLCGEVIPLGGIACVSTKSSARRQGLSSRLLEESIRRMQAWGLVVSTLQTGVPAHYGKLGWEVVPLYQKTLRVDRSCTPSFQVRPLDLSAELAQVSELHKIYTSKLNGPVYRSPLHWQKFINDKPIRWWAADADGRLLAYLCLDCRNDSIFVKEFGALPEAEAVFDPFIVRVLDRLNRPDEVITCPSQIASRFETVEWFPQHHWMARLIVPFQLGHRFVRSTDQLVELLAGSPGEGGRSSFTFWEDDGF